MTKRGLLTRLLIGTAVCVTGSVPAMAQDNAGASTGAGDIIVTARRMEERLQDVPISITVFDQQQLDNRNVFAAKDLATYTPSLAVSSRYGADFAAFSIRGFTQEARTTASVGTYFADVVMPRSSGMAASGDGAGPGAMFDLENVQVLKGPQGTLFGRNTTGGAVILTPKRPTREFGGYVEGGLGNYDMRRVQAVVNLPASDRLRFRAGVDWQKRDGYLKNVSGVGPSDLGDISYVAARFSAVWDVTDDIENYTIASYSRSNPNGMVPKMTDCNAPTDASRQPVFEAGPYSLYCQQIDRMRDEGKYAVTTWLPWQHQTTEMWQVINNTRWKVNDSLTIKNIASYGEVRQDQAMDLFGVFNPLGQTVTMPTTTSPYFDIITVNPQFVGTYYGSDTSISAYGYHAGHQSTFSEELQFQGEAFGSRLIWQAGAYYERSRPLGYSGSQSLGGICASREEFNTFTCTDPAAALGSSTPILSRNLGIGKINYRNIGLYAQGTFNITERLSLDAGFRYTWDKSWGSGRMVSASYEAATGWNTPTFSCIMPDYTYIDSFADCTQDVSQKSNAPTWVVGLNYKPIDDVMLYGKYSRGYRQGAISPNAAYGFKTYGPEQVDVYEVGVKSSWRGAVPGYFNISAFYNDFDDMQLQVSFVDVDPRPPHLTPNPAIVNAASARIKGFEIESMIEPFEGLKIQAAYSYLHTRLRDYIVPDMSGQPEGGYSVVSGGPTVGNRLQYTPKYKLTVSANYTLPVPSEVGEITVGGVFVRTGTVYYGEDTTQAIRYDSIFAPGDKRRDYRMAPAYNLVDFNLNWNRIMDSQVDLGLFVNNAFNKLYYTDRSPGSRGWVVRYIGTPRTYGLRVRVNY